MKYYLLLFITPFLILKAQDLVPDFNSPRSTFNYFLKSMKTYKLGDKSGLDLAIKTFRIPEKPEKSDSSTQKLEHERLAQLAKKLSATLDRLEYIDVTKIPINPPTPKWSYLKKYIELDGKRIEVEISLERGDDKKWKFGPRTIESITHLEEFTRADQIVEGVVIGQNKLAKFKSFFPKWFFKNSFLIYNWQWFGIFFLIFISLILEKILRSYLASFITKFFAKVGVQVNDRKKSKLTLPIAVMTYGAIWFLCVDLLGFKDDLTKVLTNSSKLAFTVAAILMLLQITDILSIYFLGKAHKTENKFDDILVPIISKTVKTLVIIAGVIFIGESLDFDMKNILAGLGIGGLAFALAAKDTLSNLFGSITIILDRPFQIGDWVVISDKVDGIVEHVGLRSTRIRTFYDSLITLPNGIITNTHIDNFGKRRFRRLSCNLGLEYSTPPEKVEAFCEGVRNLIKDHPHTRKDNFHVYFNSYGDFSLNILLYVFWSVPNWSSELNEKHRLLLDILRLAKKLDVNFAFPTQTIHMKNSDQDQSLQDSFITSDYIKTSQDYAKEIADNKMTAKYHRSDIWSLKNREL